jgi:uncharacterized ParB-like nuclease family protein
MQMMIRFKEYLSEKIKIELSHNPEARGSNVNYKHLNEPVTELSVDDLTTFEGDDKTEEGTASKQSRKVVERVKRTLKYGKNVEPIMVIKKGTGYVVVDGHHRFQAHKELGLKTVKARIVKPHNIKYLDKEEDFQ